MAMTSEIERPDALAIVRHFGSLGMSCQSRSQWLIAAMKYSSGSCV